MAMAPTMRNRMENPRSRFVNILFPFWMVATCPRRDHTTGMLAPSGTRLLVASGRTTRTHLTCPMQMAKNASCPSHLQEG